MIREVLVVIPACDEEDHIGACLLAVERAATHCPVSVSCLVALDSCTDGTAAVLRRHPAVRVVPGRWSAVGRARHAAIRSGIGSGGHLPSMWIACTDADSRPPADWLVAMVELADRGADVVCGAVRPDLAEAESRRRWRRHYEADTARLRIHGANLGLRASTYLTLGGFAPVATGEDRRLVDRAGILGRARVVDAPSLVVDTSARRRGRAPDGMAADVARVLDDVA